MGITLPEQKASRRVAELTLKNLAVSNPSELKNIPYQKLREAADKADEIAQAFMKAYPSKKPADALYVDTWLRTRALKTMNAKAAQNGAPVYAYVFTWETPVMGGYAMAYHCSELPFVFNNIALSETATGGGEKAKVLADKVSQA